MSEQNNNGGNSWVNFVERFIQSGRGSKLVELLIKILEAHGPLLRGKAFDVSAMETALDQALAEGRMTSEDYLRFKALLRAG